MTAHVKPGPRGPLREIVCLLALAAMALGPMSLGTFGNRAGAQPGDVRTHEVPTGVRITLPAYPGGTDAPDGKTALAGAGADGSDAGTDGSAERVRLDARMLLDLFHANDYRIDAVRSGELPVPRLVLNDLPPALTEIADSSERKAVFVKTMLPLVLIANERIERDRARLRKLHAQREAGHEPAPQDRVWLEQIAAQYGLETDGGVDTRALLRRVDIVPPSLALAQAAEESGWGTSRFAQQGNALFGQLTWSEEHEGIVPRNRRAGESHRFRSFGDLQASVDAYIHNLNTHAAYLPFRTQRASLRRQGRALDGYTLAAALERYSERGADYVRAIRAVMRSSRLRDFDNAVLNGAWTASGAEEADAAPEATVRNAVAGTAAGPMPTVETVALPAAPPRKPPAIPVGVAEPGAAGVPAAGE
ncbi:glucosaminidase domain-containing protein [Rhodocista pekingensis]|uniref:Glucosaminidase domain-containing protein n=1 Tax=Rhodocista pekingensis TaxID=201185 RepID=A0ABW2KXI9_9PROT